MTIKFTDFFNRWSVATLIILCSFFSALPQANSSESVDIFKASAQSNLSNNQFGAGQNIFVSEPSFLPVNEAYQFSAYIEDDALVLHWLIAPEYYLYQERFTLHQGDKTLTPTYSDAILQYDELFERETLLHYGSAELRVKLSELTGSENIALSYQGCADAGLCYPPESRHLEIDPATNTVKIISTELAPALKADATSQSSPSMNWWYAAFLALLGGVILNVMPCVFPVLSIKILQLTHTAPKKMAAHGVAYTFGILLTFMALASLLVALKATGATLGWGFQLQSPPVIALLFFLFLLMGFALSGVITIGSSWMGAGDKLTRGTNLRASFFTGILAAIVASPCTAPLMGVAIGFALTQSIPVTLIVFAALGLGMALPMLLLSLFPRWLNALPQPGAWMETIKEFLAFPLYLSAIWLLWVYGRQTDISSVAILLITLLAIIFLVWINKRIPHKPLVTLLLTFVGASAIIWSSFHQTTIEKRHEAAGFWKPYSPEVLQTLIDKNQPVFVNLTADWCITCLANEKAVLELDSTEAVFAKHNITALKGDWTNTDPEITKLLNLYGRSGVPLYLWYPAGKGSRAIVLPQILTKNTLFSHLGIKEE